MRLGKEKMDQTVTTREVEPEEKRAGVKITQYLSTCRVETLIPKAMTKGR